MDDLLREFLTETGESLDVVDAELVRFEQEPDNAKTLQNVFRLVHTIKGTCGFLGLPRLEALTHAAETLMSGFRAGRPITRDSVSLILATVDRIKVLLDALEREEREPQGSDADLIVLLQGIAAKTIAAPTGFPPIPSSAAALKSMSGEEVLLRPDVLTSLPAVEDAPRTGVSTPDGSSPPEDRLEGKVAGSSIRLNIDMLDHLMTMVSELVLTRNQLIEIVRRCRDSEFAAPLQRLSHVTAELQESVLKTRMQPVGNAWQKLPGIVRDLSAELRKPISLEMTGAETELDRQLLDIIKDPLTHMVRNAADHGLEAPEQRIAAGKPERGMIRLFACHEGGHILIEISDDGRGLDIERIRAKAIALGLGSETEINSLTEAQVQRFIFAPGFSTADTVTSISGRGIGMDVVRANVEKIGGTIDVTSSRGKGTVFTVKIPLTLAIVSALIIKVGGDRFAIPQSAVLEIVRVRDHSNLCVERIKDSPVLRLRDKLLPVIDLKSVLGMENLHQSNIPGSFVVVMQVGMQSFGLAVDGVIDTEEIVVKPMSAQLRNIAVFCGNTILGDGSVILILEPNGIAEAIGVRRKINRATLQSSEMASKQAPTESMLVFRAGSANPKALPVSLVTRLEEVDAATIEMLDGRSVIQYRGRLLPLVPASDSMQIKSEGTLPLLVLSDNGVRFMGLAVDAIIDIVEDRLAIELMSERPGMLGSAVIKGQATEIVDVSYFLRLAYAFWRNCTEQTAERRKRAVLLVDDAPFFRAMMAPAVKAAGYALTTVPSGAEALSLLQSGQHFDCVITDIEMPGADGFDLVRALRANARTAKLPIIGLSSVLSADALERCRQVGLHLCVAKLDRSALIAALDERAAA